MQRKSFFLVAALFLAAFAFGCQEHHSLEVKDLLSLKVEVERNRSCERCDNYLDFSTTDPVVFTVTVTALDADGAVCTDFNRPVRLQVVPGEIEINSLGIPQKEPWYKGAVLHLRNGRARTSMALRKSYGDNVRIWVEDSLKRWKCNLFCGEVYWGEEPRTLGPDTDIQECCGMPPGIDLFEEAPDREPTFVGAVSDQICFLTPSIRDVQEPVLGASSPVVDSSAYKREKDAAKQSGIEKPSGDGDRLFSTEETYPSPLDGESIIIKRGRLVVSSTVGDGFYFTDVDPLTAGDPPAFNHGFAYNYSYPEGLLPGDIISEVSGILTEFFGFTEMSFPAWEKKVRAGGPGGSGPKCVGADLITSRGSTTVESPSVDFGVCGTRLGDRLNVTISSYEDIGGVYDIETVRGHQLVLAKPFEITRNAIPFSVSEVYEQSLPARKLVASETGDDLLMEQYECGLVEVTDAVIKSVSLGDYYEYGQWPVDIGGGSGADLNIVTRNILPDFDPQKNVGKTIEVLRGMLRQHQYAEPQWIVYPRSHTDITCTECDPPL